MSYAIDEDCSGSIERVAYLKNTITRYGVE